LIEQIRNVIGASEKIGDRLCRQVGIVLQAGDEALGTVGDEIHSGGPVFRLWPLVRHLERRITHWSVTLNELLVCAARRSSLRRLSPTAASKRKDATKEA
jgi:hypothetical protein